MLDKNHLMEELCKAYMHAVCSMAGCTISKPDPDYGIDCHLEEINKIDDQFLPTGICLDIQAKSTTNFEIKDNLIVYNLKNRNYNLLIKNTTTKRILVLLLLPKEKDEWLNNDINSLIIKKCAFWCQLNGKEKENPDNLTTIKIPTNQIFSPDNLKEILFKIKQGRDLNGN